MGIEPTSKAWEAFVLPLNYTRTDISFYGRKSAAAIDHFRQWDEYYYSCINGYNGWDCVWGV